MNLDYSIILSVYLSALNTFNNIFKLSYFIWKLEVCPGIYNKRMRCIKIGKFGNL